MGVVGFAIALLAVVFVIGAEIRPNARQQKSSNHFKF